MATTFDVYRKGDKTLVRFNNKEMTLAEFVQKAANRDPEAIEVLTKLKQHPKFKQTGNLQTFLTQYLKDDDRRLDLVIKKKLTQYDNDEISRNSGDKQEVTKPPRYINPRDMKPLPSQRKKLYFKEKPEEPTVMRIGK